MAVTSFQDFDLATRTVSVTVMRPRNAYADGPVRKTSRMRSTGTHIWYDADNQDKFTAYKLLTCDVVDEKLVAVLAAERASTWTGSTSRRRSWLVVRPVPRVRPLRSRNRRSRSTWLWGRSCRDRPIRPALGYMQGCGCPPSWICGCLAAGR